MILDDCFRKQSTHFVIQMPLVREAPKTLEMLSLMFHR